MTAQTAMAATQRDLESCRILMPDEERALARRYRAGDRSAAEPLARGVLRFAMKTASRYFRRGYDAEDVVGDAYLGVAHALSVYDPTRGARLSSPVKWWALHYIQRHLLPMRRIVASPVSPTATRIFHRLSFAEGLLQQERESGGATPEAHEARVAEACDASPRLVSQARVTAQQDRSFDDPISRRDPDSDTLHDVTPDPRAESPEGAAVAGSVHAAMRRIVAVGMGALDPRSQHILRRRYMDDPPATLQVLAVELGLSRERVRQVETDAKRRMRAAIEARSAGAVRELLD